jgi:hypothetical protein
MNWVSILILFLCILISSGILYLFLTRKIGVVESLLYATIFNYFYISFLGPTINVLFLVSYVVSLVLAFNTREFHRKTLLLTLLIGVCFLIFLFTYSFADTGLETSRYSTVLLNELYFLIKYLFPVLVIVNFLLLHTERKDVIFSAFGKVTLLSCHIAVIQLLVFLFIHNNQVREVFGLINGNKYSYEVGSVELVRLQAFCYEPKGLSAIIGMGLPLFFSEKKFLKVLYCFVIGLLTVSQTFFLVLLAYLFVVTISKVVKRATVVGLISITSFFLLFNAVNLIVDQFLSSKGNSILYKVVLNRALDRFDVSLKEGNNDLWGLPLQQDIEMPAVNYLKDHSAVMVSGFGAGNYQYLPKRYFVTDWNLDLIAQHAFKGHFDMGWIFFACELGLVFTVLFYLFFTSGIIIRDRTTLFFCFLLVVFFFHRIDLLFFSFMAMANPGPRIVKPEQI